ncbi:MAG: phosphatidate cytidylyltransferase [Rickettsiales bacterium]|nr:phosphatidate cytidylyltransferase [Rickettsiales bacterium]
MVNKILNYNLLYRIVSAAVLIPIVLYITYIGDMAFTVMLFFIVMLMSFEWQRMIPEREFGAWKWRAMGVAYIIIPIVSFVWLRDGEFGYIGIMWLLFTVWGADSMAFFCGKLIGGAKLSKISPNKTWAGLFGALIGGTLFGVGVLVYFAVEITVSQVFYSFVVASLSQCGDLFESAIKRRLNVKDTGNVIPGHGGILDRLDSMIFSVVFVVLIVIFNLW